MAKVTTFTFGTDNWDADASELKSYFDDLHCSLIETELLTEYNLLVTIDNEIQLKFYGYGAPGAHVSIIIDGTETSICNTCGSYGVKTYTIAYSDYFVSINYSDTRTGAKYYFIYEKIDTIKLYGYSTSILDLTNLLINDLDSNNVYSHGKILNYTCDINKIEYTDEYLWTSSGTQKTSIGDSNFIACSSVTNNQIITFNGINYYTIGTNTLVELDSED